MKIFITGHTKGIGKAIWTAQGGEPNCIGFSRSNGYDLTIKEHRERMCMQLKDCRVFINNAFMYDDPKYPDHMWTQTQILYEVYDRMNIDQLIINIGSNTVDENPRKVWPYQAAKAGLDKAIYQLQYIQGGPMVTSIKFGYVGTEKILKEYKPEKYVSLTQVCKSVNHIIDAANNGFLINNMLIRAHE
tara:strand:- start:687 stop:1250 length:564 start_codon:yes stop_codon:yes gene_type:complete